MMARGIVIPLSANPRDLIRGLRVSEDAVEDLGREFDQVERKTDDVSDEFRKLGRNADRNFDKARRSADRLGDELDDVETEANQSAKEFGASFRGDPVEALEEVQSYLSEIVAVKLPGFAGAVATIAGGAVLGAVVAGVEAWREKQERIQEYADGYLDSIKDTEGPLQKWQDGYDALIDKQLALNVIEEASAATQRDLAILAAARGESLDEYINKLITGELSTQEELRRITQERRDIANQIDEIALDNNKTNDALIPKLKEQERVLGKQAEALRAQGGFINENVAGIELAKSAEEELTRATQSSYEKQLALNRASALGADNVSRAASRAADLDYNLRLAASSAGNIAIPVGARNLQP